MVMFMPKMFELPIINNKQRNCISGSGFFPALIHRSSIYFFPGKFCSNFSLSSADPSFPPKAVSRNN